MPTFNKKEKFMYNTIMLKLIFINLLTLLQEAHDSPREEHQGSEDEPIQVSRLSYICIMFFTCLQKIICILFFTCNVLTEVSISKKKNSYYLLFFQPEHEESEEVLYLFSLHHFSPLNHFSLYSFSFPTFSEHVGKLTKALLFCNYAGVYNQRWQGGVTQPFCFNQLGAAKATTQEKQESQIELFSLCAL